jgi:hypothetical protein
MYLALKYAHVVIAITALGAGTAVGVMLGFFADDPTHGEFALRVARRLLWIVVAGYVLMLLTGMWMGHLENLLDARWTEMAMNIWGVGALFIGLAMRSLIRARGARAALSARLFMAGWGVVLLVILYFMVFKPG